ncbi:unnamed protein product [Brugia timori]|uniref:2-Hacid_dh_C domain-containing protein n=1 Tax=Brugia timori TaxID=42155 RepID=A0A0R3QJ31_9BILA|nr:unnamed protein product [Brugia timori]
MAEGKKHALAIGLTKMSADEILTVNKAKFSFLCTERGMDGFQANAFQGIGIENLHHLNDGLWKVPTVL